jgi:ectoine hydroxylase-related dioxygenase (phytanoyl-CoA dioxygenase family)
MHNITITDKQVEQELNEKGFVVKDLLDESEINSFLSDIFLKINNANTKKLNYNTGADLDTQIKNYTFEKIQKVLPQKLDCFFSGYEIISGIMFIKRPSNEESGQVGLHFDPTLLPDESVQRHIDIWIPLIDVDENNGALWMVPGTHRIFPPAHAITIPFPFSNIKDVVQKHGQCIKMKAGQGLIFDNRTIHYSLQNFSSSDRPVLVLSFVPYGTEFISLYKAPGDSPIEVYKQSKDWYRHPEWSNDIQRPRIGEFIGHLNYEPFFATEKEFIESMASGIPIRNYTFEIL